MFKGFKFTLLAASYSSGGQEYREPFTIILPDGDSRLAEFRGNRAFKEESVDFPAPVAKTVSGKEAESETAPTDSTGNVPDSKVEALALDDVLDRKLVKLLKENGYDTVDLVLELTETDLQMINGIGEASAKKILSECGMAKAGQDCRHSPAKEAEPETEEFED